MQPVDPYGRSQNSRASGTIVVAVVLGVPLIAGLGALAVRLSMNEVTDLVTCQAHSVEDLGDLLPITAENAGRLQHVGTLCGPEDAVIESILFFEDEARLAVASNKPAIIEDYRTGEQSSLSKTEFHGTLAMLDAQRLVLGGASLQVWNVDTKERLYSSLDEGIKLGLTLDHVEPAMKDLIGKAADKLGTEGIRGIWVGPDEQMITVERDGMIRHWDHTPALQEVVDTPARASTYVAIHSAGVEFVGSSMIGTVGYGVDGAPRHQIPVTSDEIRGVYYAPQGNELAVLRRPAQVVFYDTTTGESTKTWDVADITTNSSLRYAPDGLVIAVGTEHGALKLFSPEGERLTSARAALGQIRALAFRSDQRLLASGDRSGAVRLWGVRSSAP